MQKWRLEGPLKDMELLPYAVAGPLIRDLLEAVSFLYDAGIVHLNMKLDNLFMRRDGGLAVGFLGEAKLLVRTTGCRRFVLKPFQVAAFVFTPLDSGVLALDAWLVAVIAMFRASITPSAD